MADAFAFNARTVEPAKPRENSAVPMGWYRAWIKSSEIKNTNAGDGRYIELVWEIVDGPHAKRLIWDRLNVENQNAVAVEIAQKALSAICHAVGVLEMQHTGQLHGVVCAIKVGIEQKKGYEPKNVIRGYVPDGDPIALLGKPKVGSGAVGAVHGARSSAVPDDDDPLPF
jgi:hypothetical protein